MVTKTENSCCHGASFRSEGKTLNIYTESGVDTGVMLTEQHRCREHNSSSET